MGGRNSLQLRPSCGQCHGASDRAMISEGPNYKFMNLGPLINGAMIIDLNFNIRDDHGTVSYI